MLSRVPAGDLESQVAPNTEVGEGPPFWRLGMSQLLLQEKKGTLKLYLDGGFLAVTCLWLRRGVAINLQLQNALVAQEPPAEDKTSTTWVCCFFSIPPRT